MMSEAVATPDVVPAVAKEKNARIGVVGTKATVKSDMYAKKILLKNKKATVSSLATPLLAPMIEEGFFNNKISRTIINDYLSRPKLRNINTLILGCTHYPLIKPEIEQFYGNKVNIVDSAQIVAQHVKEVLLKNGMMNTGKAKKHHFYISDFTSSFEYSTRLFFKGNIKLEKMDLWK